MSSDSSIFTQMVPLFNEFAPRIVTLAELAKNDLTILDSRLVPDTFSAGEHFVVAQGFILRTIFPVIGRECPELNTEDPTTAGIIQRHLELMAILGSIGDHDFTDAETLQISHIAGDAKIRLNATDYVQLFGVPNFFFHLTMGYASLRAAGVKVGKAQFDGLHQYSPGFTFSNKSNGK